MRFNCNSKNEKMDRRKFFKSSGALCGLAVFGSVAFLEGCQKSSTSPQGPSANFTLDLNKATNASLNTVGGSVSSNGVVVANSEGTYVAVAQACTHQGCSVFYDNNGKDFVCPCHDGIFGTDGSVLSGPPPSALKSYTVTKNGSILTISG